MRIASAFTALPALLLLAACEPEAVPEHPIAWGEYMPDDLVEVAHWRWDASLPRNVADSLLVRDGVLACPKLTRRTLAELPARAVRNMAGIALLEVEVLATDTSDTGVLCFSWVGADHGDSATTCIDLVPTEKFGQYHGVLPLDPLPVGPEQRFRVQLSGREGTIHLSSIDVRFRGHPASTRHWAATSFEREGMVPEKRLVRTPVHSGSLACSLKDVEFGPSLELAASQSGTDVDALLAGIWLHASRFPEGFTLVGEVIGADGERKGWFGKDLGMEGFIPGQWIRLQAEFLLRHLELDPEDTFSVIVWNRQKASVVIDDMELVLRRTQRSLDPALGLPREQYADADALRSQGIVPREQLGVRTMSFPPGVSFGADRDPVALLAGAGKDQFLLILPDSVVTLRSEDGDLLHVGTHALPAFPGGQHIITACRDGDELLLVGSGGALLHCTLDGKRTGGPQWPGITPGSPPLLGVSADGVMITDTLTGQWWQVDQGTILATGQHDAHMRVERSFTWEGTTGMPGVGGPLQTDTASQLSLLRHAGQFHAFPDGHTWLRASPSMPWPELWVAEDNKPFLHATAHTAADGLRPFHAEHYVLCSAEEGILLIGRSGTSIPGIGRAWTAASSAAFAVVLQQPQR